MTTEEMKELDAWIAEHVMGWKLWKEGMSGDLVPVWLTGDDESPTFKWFRPTTDPAAAMMVLKKCMERVVVTCAGPREGDNLWYVCQDFRGDNESGESATTLELAIAKFSRQLFSK